MALNINLFVLAQFYDTLLGEYIQAPWTRGLSLDKLSLRDFNYEMISYDEILQKKKLRFDEVDLLAAADYSCEDVYMTHKLYEKQVKNKTTQIWLLHDIEIPLLSVLKDMEITWVKIDRNKLKWIWLLLAQELENLQKSIFDEVWEEFNINSPKQVGVILFEKLALPKGKKTKTGYSVSAEVLWELSHQFPIAQKIVDFRHYSKLQSTYIDWLLEIADENDFIHTSYNAAVTTTGRLSSTSPNLQNIPSSAWIAGEIRDWFVSRFEWWKIMASDYSQVEVRLLAIMSGDENLLEAFKQNKDIHRTTAEFLFPNQTLTSDHRKIAKAVNFWVIYWISTFGLSKMIGINMKDAKIYIDTFYNSYPKVKEFFDEQISFCEQNWYVQTLYGRRRYMPGINDKNAIIKNAARREAMNMPIQWTSADIIKLSMVKIHKYLSDEKIKSQLIMQVHDELVFDVYPWEEKVLWEKVTHLMENILTDTPIVLKTDTVFWDTWKEAK